MAFLYHLHRDAPQTLVWENRSLCGVMVRAAMGRKRYRTRDGLYKANVGEPNRPVSPIRPNMPSIRAETIGDPRARWNRYGRKYPF